LPRGRLAGLGATVDLHHGLLAAVMEGRATFVVTDDSDLLKVKEHEGCVS
jgi:hypothetical protein